MREDTGLRFRLVNKLMAMAYGNNLKIEREHIQSAWPPTGDHDRSIEGAFRAMALAKGGNRPEESYTTEERITNDLDGSFSFQLDQSDGGYVFHRKISSCPRCKGRGVVQTYRPVSSVFSALNAAVLSDEVVTVASEQCGHKP